MSSPDDGQAGLGVERGGLAGVALLDEIDDGFGFEEFGHGFSVAWVRLECTQYLNTPAVEVHTNYMHTKCK
jgi:hypothetical protein